MIDTNCNYASYNNFTTTLPNTCRWTCFQDTRCIKVIYNSNTTMCSLLENISQQRSLTSVEECDTMHTAGKYFITVFILVRILMNFMFLSRNVCKKF